MNDLKALSKEPNHVAENINQAPDSPLCIPPPSSGLKIRKYRVPSDVGGYAEIGLSQPNA